MKSSAVNLVIVFLALFVGEAGRLADDGHHHAVEFLVASLVVLLVPVEQRLEGGDVVEIVLVGRSLVGLGHERLVEVVGEVAVLVVALLEGEVVIALLAVAEDESFAVEFILNEGNSIIVLK